MFPKSFLTIGGYLKNRPLNSIAIGAIFFVMLGCYKSEVKDFFESRNSPIVYKSLIVPFKGTSWGPRKTPAEVTQETELELKKKGYIKIGEIEIKKVAGYCYYDNQCDNKFVSSPTKRLLSEAAKRGGD
jgi:hypothetical protein